MKKQSIVVIHPYQVEWDFPVKDIVNRFLMKKKRDSEIFVISKYEFDTHNVYTPEDVGENIESGDGYLIYGVDEAVLKHTRVYCIGQMFGNCHKRAYQDLVEGFAEKGKHDNLEIRLPIRMILTEPKMLRIKPKSAGKKFYRLDELVEKDRLTNNDYFRACFRDYIEILKQNADKAHATVMYKNNELLKFGNVHDKRIKVRVE